MRAALSRISIVAALLLAVLASVGVHPSLVRAQDDAARFDDALLARTSQASAAGPLAGTLIQTEGFVTTVGAGVSVADFAASAAFVNPPDDSEPWDIGFSFRRNGNEVQQLVIDSLGFWYDSPYPAGNDESGIAASFDPNPGASNTVDLVVEGTRALFGVNGVFVAGFDLAGAIVAADVEIGTGYFVGSVVDGRAIRYQDFEVWPLAASETVVLVPTATAVGETPTPEPGLAVTVTPEPLAAVSAEDAERFASVLAAQATVEPFSGPYNAILREVAGVVMVAWADVNLSDFHASATAEVPADAGGVPWDVGFMFGTSPNGTLRVAVDAQGQVFLSVGAAGPAVIGQASGLRTNPGETNTLDLLVAGDRVWLGVNGELVATTDLPVDASASDVGFGSGFYSDQTVADRLLAFDEFAVRSLDPGALGETSDATGLTPEQLAEFATLISDTENVAPLVGPFSGRLVEATAGSVPLAPAGVSLADFGATATFVNPDNPNGALWDSGFRFRDDGTNNNRIVIDSLGDVYVLLAGEDARKVATAASYDASAGGSNTLQLFVDGDQALFGVNGELVAAIALGAPPVASDVQIGTGFFNEDFVVGRVTDYREFQVWEMA